MKQLLHAMRLLLVMTIPAQANMPPTKYDKPYTQGKTVSYLVEYGKAWDKCSWLHNKLGYGEYSKGFMRIGNRKLFGCQMFEGTKCHIVFSYDPSGQDKAMKSNVFRHERAHCNGWIHN